MDPTLFLQGVKPICYFLSKVTGASYGMVPFSRFLLAIAVVNTWQATRSTKHTRYFTLQLLQGGLHRNEMLARSSLESRTKRRSPDEHATQNGCPDHPHTNSVLGLVPGVIALTTSTMRHGRKLGTFVHSRLRVVPSPFTPS